MGGRYIFPAGNFLHISGGTVTGVTNFIAGLSGSTVSGGTLYSGSTELGDVIQSYVTGGTSNIFLPISGGTGGPYLFTGGTTAGTLTITSGVTPSMDNAVDLGTPFRRFRTLNTVNGVSVNFTASTQIQLGSRILTEYNTVITGDTVCGGIY